MTSAEGRFCTWVVQQQAGGKALPQPVRPSPTHRPAITSLPPWRQGQVPALSATMKGPVAQRSLVEPKVLALLSERFGQDGPRVHPLRAGVVHDLNQGLGGTKLESRNVLMVPTKEQNKAMGLTHSAQYQHCTHLENAGYERNKKSQNISNFLMGNLKQIGGTQEKEYLGERTHSPVWHG